MSQAPDYSRLVLFFLPLLLLSLCLLVPTAAQSTSSSSAPVQSKFPIRGVLMALAFGLFLPLGIVLARFFRSPLYSPVWFLLHQALMLVGFALIIAGFGLGVNRSNDDDFRRDSEYTLHRRAGFYVFAAIGLQVLIGFL